MLQRMVLVGSLIALAAGCAQGPQPEREALSKADLPRGHELVRNNPVLEPGDLKVLDLEMDPLDARVLFRKEPFDRSSFPVTLLVDGARHEGRVEVLGSSSRRFAKKSILIKLREGEAWRGQRRIALDAMANDGSMMRERLAWDTIEALGMAAPRVRYRRLHINGELIGVFLQTEWIRPALFARFGLGTEGVLFSPDSSAFCGDLTPMDAGRAAECWNVLSSGGDGIRPIVKLGRRIDATPVEEFDTFLAEHFHVDSVIDWFLINTLTNNGDTYNKNYFLYRAPADSRWTVVPFDYDLTFGHNFDPYLAYPRNIFNEHFVYYYPPQLGAYSPLKEKVLRNDALRGRFLTRLRHLMGLKPAGYGKESFGLWHPEVMGERIAALREALKSYARLDRYQPQSRVGFRREVETVAYYTRARWHYLRAKMFGRFPWNADSAHWDPQEAPPPPPLPETLYAADTTWQAGDGDSLAMVAPGYGYILAMLDDIRPGDTARLRFSVEVDMNQPPAVAPPLMDPRQCVQRTWFLILKTPADHVRADLTLEYLQENSKRNELGEWLDEGFLELWLYGGRGWWPLNARTNPEANTLQASRVVLPSGRLLRFVACSPGVVERAQRDPG
ncbi:CotH kinase family protein [Thiohalorhabdus methylotrophus]|uniref:CotH kinase family protein n=1 Tax=Thiohalorhabdus methylotrophus TaxID=3242694 RepID=A0ABV4TPN2_9GAMM